MIDPVLGITVEVQQHVIGEVFQIEVVLNLTVSGRSGRIDADHGIPPGTGTAEIFVDLPVLFLTTEMIGEKVVLNALGEVVDPPIEAVDIEVDKISITGWLAHRSQAVLHPDVTDIHRVVRPVAGGRPISQGP